jgi:hypothetical protein
VCAYILTIVDPDPTKMATAVALVNSLISEANQKVIALTSVSAAGITVISCITLKLHNFILK